jgi:hypothetical protein
VTGARAIPDDRAPLAAPLFRFAQVELPWALGPPDGRYLARPDGQADAPPSHVIVFATLGAVERRRMFRRGASRPAAPAPDPAPVVTGRATVIDVAHPLSSAADAAAWVRSVGEVELEQALVTLNRALTAFRIVSADPFLRPVGRGQALVARVGYGEGEQVADGLWTEARELTGLEGGLRPRRRARMLAPQARLAAVLAGREPALACEELILRARLDLDQRRGREGALQLLVALDAALAELSGDPAAEFLAGRLDELRGQRELVAAAAQSALTGPLTAAEEEVVSFTVARIEATLRARAVARG